MKPLVRNAGDAEQVKDAEQKVKFGRERELNDIRHVLNSVQGRRTMYRYIERCGVYEISANNSGSWTYFNEGQRNIGLILLKDITEASSDAYALMMKENKGDN